MGVEHRLDVGHVSLVERECDVEQRRRLQVDPAPPTVPRLGYDRPADAGLGADAVDVGPNGGSPMRIGRTQAELHPSRDVASGPIGRAILVDHPERGGEVAGRIRGPPPDMGLVEVLSGQCHVGQDGILRPIGNRPDYLL